MLPLSFFNNINFSNENLIKKIITYLESDDFLIKEYFVGIDLIRNKIYDLEIKSYRNKRLQPIVKKMEKILDNLESYQSLDLNDLVIRNQLIDELKEI